MKILTKVLETFIYPQDEPRDYIGASGIGDDCWRKIWYDFNGYEKEPVSNKTRRTWEIGKRLEAMLLDLLTKAHIQIETPSPENAYLFYADDEYTFFQGHFDAILRDPYAVLEIKTANDTEFKKFVAQGLRKWQKKYYAQVQAYMGMSGIEQAFLIAVNKDTSELHDELIVFDKDYYEELRIKARIIYEAKEPPPRVNQSPAWYQCKMCQYKGICHEGI